MLRSIFITWLPRTDQRLKELSKQSVTASRSLTPTTPRMEAQEITLLTALDVSSERHVLRTMVLDQLTMLFGIFVRMTAWHQMDLFVAILNISNGIRNLQTCMMLSPKEYISVKRASPQKKLLALAENPLLLRFKFVSVVVILESFLLLAIT